MEGCSLDVILLVSVLWQAEVLTSQQAVLTGLLAGSNRHFGDHEQREAWVKLGTAEA